MKVLLTGITGNLGYEVAHDLIQRGITVVPVIRRPARQEVILDLKGQFKEGVVYGDLLGDAPIKYSGDADCIVHCAGVVHFRDTRSANEKMTLKVIDIAQKLKIPVYLISTAFVYRPISASNVFNNSYEEDKWKAEQALINSDIPYTIFRPSILTGNSQTGKIQNFSGYYMGISAFLSAMEGSRKEHKVRFPRLSGLINMIPVDQAAQSMGNIIENRQSGLFYITTPNPPVFDWVLEESLDFFRAKDRLEFMDCSFEEFGKLELSDQEKKLYKSSVHFYPYWSINYDFPASVCADNLIDTKYLEKILKYFQQSNNSTNE